MKTTLKISSCFILTLFLFTFSCSSDDDSGGSVTFSFENLVTNFDENPNLGDVVGTVQATSPGNLSFNITSQTPIGALSISASTGELTVANPTLFDFETYPIISATVSVIDPDNSEIANVTININDLDAIADFLSTSGADYAAAAAGDWIAITEGEYNALAGNLNEVTKAATSDADYTNSMVASSDSFGDFTASNNNGETMPSGSYVFAFKSSNHAVSTTNKVKQSSTSSSDGFMDLGNVLPSHGAGENYFVLKDSNNPTTAIGYLGMYANVNQRFKSIPGKTSSTDFGDVNTITGTENLVILYQGLSTTQKQW